MISEIQLRPGVVFQVGAAGTGSIALPKERRFENVSFCGTLPATTENGAPARVHVLSAVYPTILDQQPNSRQLPALVVVATETRYLKGASTELCSLFLLDRMIESGHDLDLGRTVVLTMHGSVDVGEDDQLIPGRPSLPSVSPSQWISLDPAECRGEHGLLFQYPPRKKGYDIQ